jgi:acylphosphatase
MSIFKYIIKITGNFSKKGFGFSCMHLAYQNDVTGSFFYESPNSVIIEVYGTEDSIDHILEHCRKAEFVEHIRILEKQQTEKKSTEFIMLNQIE